MLTFGLNIHLHKHTSVYILTLAQSMYIHIQHATPQEKSMNLFPAVAMMKTCLYLLQDELELEKCPIN